MIFVSNKASYKEILAFVYNSILYLKRDFFGSDKISETKVAKFVLISWTLFHTNYIHFLIRHFYHQSFV